MSKGTKLIECASCMPAVLLRLTCVAAIFLMGFEGSSRETVCVGEHFLGVKLLMGLIALTGVFVLLPRNLLNSWPHHIAEWYSLH